MKILRYRIGGFVKPGILDREKKVRDASSLVHDWDSSTVTIEKLDSIKSIDLSTLPEIKKIAEGKRGQPEGQMEIQAQ